MIVDAQLEFSAAQALTSTGASTNYIDLGVDRDIGVGRELYLAIQVDVAADFTTGDETYAVAVQTDDNTSFSSPATIDSYTFVAADRAVGARIIRKLPLFNERYVRLNYTLGGTTPSVTLTARLVLDAQLDAYYAAGYTIA